MNHYTPLPPDANTQSLSPIVRLGPIDDLEDALQSSWRDLNRATHRFLSLLREFDLRRGWQASGCVSCADWMDYKLKVSRRTALEKLRVAKALWFVPEIDDAFKEGQLSYSQVRALTRVADEENQSELLAYALGCTAEHLEQYIQRLRHGDTETARRTARTEFTTRSLKLYAHSGEISMKLPPDVFAQVEKVLLHAMDRLPEDPTRTTEQARADALVEVITRTTSVSSTESSAEETSFEEESSAEDGPTVLVHVDVEALTGAGGESDLPLPLVKRLCCDGGVVPIHKAGARVLNVGRKQRTVPVAIRRALSARDRWCRFPGCHHRHYLQAHHIQHWSEGGQTSLENLILLCSHHHKLVHEGGFKLTATQGGYCFVRPDGRPIEPPKTNPLSSAEDGEVAIPG